MRIKVVFELNRSQRLAVGLEMGLERVANYEECRRFVESQGYMGVEQALSDHGDQFPSKEQEERT